MNDLNFDIFSATWDATQKAINPDCLDLVACSLINYDDGLAGAIGNFTINDVVMGILRND